MPNTPPNSILRNKALTGYQLTTAEDTRSEDKKLAREQDFVLRILQDWGINTDEIEYIAENGIVKIGDIWLAFHSSNLLLMHTAPIPNAQRVLVSDIVDIGKHLHEYEKKYYKDLPDS